MVAETEFVIEKASENLAGGLESKKTTEKGEPHNLTVNSAKIPGCTSINYTCMGRLHEAW